MADETAAPVQNIYLTQRKAGQSACVAAATSDESRKPKSFESIFMVGEKRRVKVLC